VPGIDPFAELERAQELVRRRRRALGVRPSLADLDALIAELNLDPYDPVVFERAWLAEHPAARRAGLVERLDDAPTLALCISSCGPANLAIAYRAAHLRQFADWWAGHAWWVVAAEIAAFEHAAAAERA
jgi:hypothetical protein